MFDWICYFTFFKILFQPKELNIIHINDRFWTRYNTTQDGDEKKKILFYVSTLIVHEIGRWLMEWSEIDKYKNYKLI